PLLRRSTLAVSLSFAALASLAACASDAGTTSDAAVDEATDAPTGASSEALSSGAVYEWDTWSGVIGNGFTESLSSSITGGAHTAGGVQLVDITSARAPGIARISKGYAAAAGEYYQAWGKAAVPLSSCDIHAEVELSFHNGKSLVGRCISSS